MGMIMEAFAPRAQANAYESSGPLSEFWYTDPSGYMVETGYAGISLSADTILRCSTVLAAVRFRGDSWAMCPPSTFRKTSTGREEDPKHYSQLVLRNPNTWMTGNRWRFVNGLWMATWGNGYNEIVGDETTFARFLKPLHPSVTKVVDQRSDGTLLYRYTPAGAPPRLLGQEKVLHFKDVTTDGIEGVPMYKLIRGVVGIALLAEQHAASFLKKGARSAGMIVPDHALEQGEKDDVRDSINKAFGGVRNSGTYGLLPHGIKLEAVPTSSNRDGQVIELGDAVVGAILRFLGVPGVVVGYMGDKTATYASAKEFFESGGLKHCVLPILANVEAEEEKALLMEGDGRQIKHNMDALQRANFRDRTAGLVQSVGGPYRTVNEARRIDDMNELEDPRYDEVLTPSNMAPELLDGGPEGGPEGRPGPPRPPGPTPADDDAADASVLPPSAPTAVRKAPATLAARPAPPEPVDEQAARAGVIARQFALDTAARLVRREVAAINGANGGVGAAVRFARDPEKWRAWVLDYYGKHATIVAEQLHIPAELAATYATGQRDALLAEGVSVVQAWEESVPQRLAAMVMEA